MVPTSPLAHGLNVSLFCCCGLRKNCPCVFVCVCVCWWVFVWQLPIKSWCCACSHTVREGKVVVVLFIFEFCFSYTLLQLFILQCIPPPPPPLPFPLLSPLPFLLFFLYIPMYSSYFPLSLLFLSPSFSFFPMYSSYCLLLSPLPPLLFPILLFISYVLLPLSLSLFLSPSLLSVTCTDLFSIAGPGSDLREWGEWCQDAERGAGALWRQHRRTAGRDYVLCLLKAAHWLDCQVCWFLSLCFFSAPPT